MIYTLAGAAPTITASGAQGAANFSVTAPSVAPTLTTLLSGNMVCVKHSQRTPVGPGPSTTWYNQEFHNASTVITDYKMGTGHAVDPSKDIGNWTVTGTDSCNLRYNYGGEIFDYSVYQNGSNISFCQGASATVTIPTSQILVGLQSCGTP